MIITKQELDRTAKIEKPTNTLMLNEIQAGFDVLRDTFFSDLSQCMLTLDTAHSSAMGFFRPNSFISKDNIVIHQIALNPSYLLTCPPEEALQTIGHEMAHQYVYDILGKRKGGGYHCKKWVCKMEEIGLIHSNTGKPGGRKTGYGISDYIQKDGRFEKVCQELIALGFCISWGSTHTKVKEQTQSPSNSSNKGKIKFSCPVCTNACWAAPSRNLVCGDHMLQMKKQ